MLIRPEQQGDYAAVNAVNVSAFETPAEADLVDALRQRAHPVVSMVAEGGDAIIGHIMFSPVMISGHPKLHIMGLGPMAVEPSQQGEGIGSGLVRAGLERCGKLGIGAVVVLGHPGFYPRFGFSQSTRFGLVCEYEVPAEAFMVLELEAGYLNGATGEIIYHAAFGEL